MNLLGMYLFILGILGFGAACFYFGKRFTIWWTNDYELRSELVRRRLQEKLHYEAKREIDDELTEGK